MKEPTMIRRGHLILSVAGVVLQDCKTINGGKRKSRELQKQGEVIRVEPHKTRPQVKVARAPSRLQRLRAIEAAKEEEPVTIRDYMRNAIAHVDDDRKSGSRAVLRRHNWSKGGRPQ